MHKSNIYSDNSVEQYIKQIWFLPFIYIVYCGKTIKEIIKHSLSTRCTLSDIWLQFAYTLVGILTINFYVYLGVEFEVLHYDFNRMINEFYFIPFYLKNFSILLIYSIVICFFFLLKKGINFEYFKSIIILNIKLFNIFMPLIFLCLILSVDLSLYYISVNKKEYFGLILIISMSFIFLLLLILYVILLFKSRKFLIEIFTKKRIAYLNLFITIILSTLIYITSFEKLTNYIEVNNMLHSNEVCDELYSFIVFKNGIEPKKDYTFYNYRKNIQECQKMFKLSNSEFLKSIIE